MSNDSDDNNEGKVADAPAPAVSIPRTTTPTTDGLSPVGPRTVTNEMIPLPKPLRVEIDLDDPRSLADFLDHVARIIRDRKRIVITIE